MHKINLLPKEILISQYEKRFRLLCISAVILLLVLSALVVAAINNSIEVLEKEIHMAQTEIFGMRTNIDGGYIQELLLNIEKRQNFYMAAENNKTVYYGVLNDIISFVPEEVNIVSISLSETNKLKINGYSPSLGYIAVYMDELKSLDDVVEVNLGFAQLTDAGHWDGVSSDYRFELNILLKKGR